MPSFIKTEDHITIVFDDTFTPTTVNKTHQFFDKIIQAVKERDWDKAKELSVAPKEAIMAQGVGRVVVKDDVVYYDGKPVHNTLTRRMVGMLQEGFDITPMIRFLNNLMLNTSNTAINELYDFLEKGDLPITEDGGFIAYKRVKGDYTDIHTGKIVNRIGEVVSMPRNAVDDNRSRTCSHGLHFCSRGYLPSYGTDAGMKTLVIKIYPENVVSIPADYNDTKGRCCRYLVVGELEHLNEAPIEGNINTDFRDRSDEFDEDDDIIGITEESLGG